MHVQGWWLCFTDWAMEQGIDPLGPIVTQVDSFLFSIFETHSFLSQTPGLVWLLFSAVQARERWCKIISDMIGSMDRPSAMPVLPE